MTRDPTPAVRRKAPAFRKSTYTNSMAACVEVADLDGGDRAVRDSKDPSGPALMFTAAGWAAFTAGVRSGEFD
ncbi:MAG: DUF397 domain-containing protein [Pseudonocardiaceae bacterium]